MPDLTLDTLIENIQSSDDTLRADARDRAGVVGATAVAPLAKIALSGELEVARAAQRAIQNIVYHAGRPGAQEEATAVAAELLALLDDSQPVRLRQDVLWMSWQIAGEEAVDTIAPLLANADLFQDARMALERLPGKKATAALQTALNDTTDAERLAVAHSLRVRGIDTPSLPDIRLQPTRTTTVQPVGRASG
jgi:hypothetical protein